MLAVPCVLRAVFLAVIFSRVASSSSPTQGLDALEECPTSDSSIYDYIVVGSGAGGGPVAARLAEHGFSVLVIETGVDQGKNINTTSASLASAAVEDPKIDLNYTIREYPPDFPIQRNNIWYPRVAAIGGCTIHNGMLNNIGGLRQTFDNLAQMFNDRTWTRDNMQSFYELLERNLYLTPPNPDHGFDGWLSTTRLASENFSSADPQYEAIGTAIINTAGPVIEDINSHLPIPHFGRGLTTATIDLTGQRSSVHDRLVQVAANSTDKLTIMTDTLATKVLLCKSRNDVVAYGVSVAPGAKLPIAEGFTGKQKLNEMSITAKREVILMLSGIGDSAQLNKFDIPSIVDLPGVGSNLQDNDELPVVWEFKQNFSSDIIPFSFGEIFATSKNSTSLEPDLDTYLFPTEFTGFKHGFNALAAATPNFFTIVNLKARASSRGYIRLTGSHPQDLLDINKLRFQAPGGQQDISDLRERVKQWREIMNAPEVQQHLEKEVLPGANVTSDHDLDNYILENVFAHHGCCTNPIGTQDDPQAVLDGDFKVRGVQNLRVVDGSSWPESPGYFPTSPTYMIAEKSCSSHFERCKVEVNQNGG
ncbi:Choline dehydrogenase [Mycena venus]|uniref:Choline dehydrogenase n=1 Tax=Mycena venus TaxID=2733690 RepID=A0A8H6XV60_9AGAR|nr:Choline dehydrogenase [Mycena venus]